MNEKIKKNTETKGAFESQNWPVRPVILKKKYSIYLVFSRNFC